MRLVPLLAALLLAGCAQNDPASDGGAVTTTTPATNASADGVAEVDNRTIDFTLGATGRQPLTMPEGAKQFTLTVSWQPQSAVAASAPLVVEVVDGSGGTLVGCSYGGVGTDARTCEKTNTVQAEQALRWEGTGAVKAVIVVVAE